ncbi:class I SAM-dependent methyltransferase [Polynucleobacter sp. AM-26B4]|uniref:class I SAM-dependent methyltransferase n=1 Tax=Polynucleobacter sp. AM-26B4 TaxID=2689103 RepID=UPI00351D39CC
MFLRDIPLTNLYGIDVMDEFVEICKDTFNSSNFSITNPFPPTQFENNFFDYVVGYSVFSHLSEQACLEWMREFYRIVKPGGIVALTTRGRPFFDYCESLKGQNKGQYADSLSTMFPSFDEAKKSYDEGRFVHSNADGVTGNGQSHAYFYGETFIPEEYARSAYAELFTLEEFIYDSERQSHPIMFFKRLG